MLAQRSCRGFLLRGSFLEELAGRPVAALLIDGPAGENRAATLIREDRDLP